MEVLKMRLDKRRQLGNLRILTIKSDLIDFASNDYLGLAQSTALRDEMQKTWLQASPCHGFLGATGSRLLTGNGQAMAQLEKEISTFHGFPAGLLFGAGYMANVGLLTAIGRDGDALIYDVQVHASMQDGLRLSRATAYPFRHNDLDHLEKRLKQTANAASRYICVESIYSTDGSEAPLSGICQLAKLYDAHVIVDEAHSVGVTGPNGCGVIAREGLTSNIFAMVATFSKALGVYGAIVLGSDLLKQTMLNFANSAIYTTALPSYSLAAIQASYAIFPTLERERRHVEQLIEIFRQLSPSDTHTQIQKVAVPGNVQARELSRKLAEKGFDVRPLLSPTIRRKNECLRICLHAFNTREQVEALVHELIKNKKIVTIHVSMDTGPGAGQTGLAMLRLATSVTPAVGDCRPHVDCSLRLQE